MQVGHFVTEIEVYEKHRRINEYVVHFAFSFGELDTEFLFRLRRELKINVPIRDAHSLNNQIGDFVSRGLAANAAMLPTSETGGRYTTLSNTWGGVDGGGAFFDGPFWWNEDVDDVDMDNLVGYAETWEAAYSRQCCPLCEKLGVERTVRLVGHLRLHMEMR